MKLRPLISLLQVNQKEGYPGWAWPNQESSLNGALKKQLPWVIQMQGNNFCQYLHKVGWHPSPKRHLLSALGDAEQSTQLHCAQTPDPQKLWSNKQVFYASKFVVIYYIAIEN